MIFRSLLRMFKKVRGILFYQNRFHMAKSVKIGRDAGSGKFIPVKEAERRPKTTVVETIKKKNK